MSGSTATRAKPGGKSVNLRVLLPAGAAAILVIAMALDTRVVRIGSAADEPSNAFSPAAFGAKEFPKVRAAVIARATDAVTLADAIAKDQEAAVKQYAVASIDGPDFAVKFTGTVGKDDDGDTVVSVPGLPSGTQIVLQIGPAIIGTALRDAPGTITFGQFSNQIEYQNAGAALNTEMKREVLSRLDLDHLAGKTVSVVGAFQLSDPSSWQVTPVQIEVEK